MANVAVQVAPDQDLAPDEVQRLTNLETVISQGIKTFLEVGLALLEINEKRLYRADAPTFEVYLQERWSISRSRGYELMSAAEVANEMSAMADTPPVENERQARALKPVIEEHGPEKAVEVLKKAEESGKVTAASIEEAKVEKGLVPKKATPAKPPAKKATPRSRKKPASEEQLALAVDLLGEGLTAIASGQLHPQAAARVAINNIQSDPKALRAFVEEINRYYEETQK